MSLSPSALYRGFDCGVKLDVSAIYKIKGSRGVDTGSEWSTQSREQCAVAEAGSVLENFPPKRYVILPYRVHPCVYSNRFHCIDSRALIPRVSVDCYRTQSFERSAWELKSFEIRNHRRR